MKELIKVYMHEVSIIQELLDIVQNTAIENNLTKIDKIHLKIGELSGVLEDSLRFAYDCISNDTLANGSELFIETVEATGRCNRCNITFKIEHFNKLCPQCSKFCDSILSGYELSIYSIKGE
jgi:hydrogenase nickel incorporation protein HypA/HybF